MGVDFRFAARSDVGLVRRQNQDSGYASHHLLVVADGMGGSAGGDIASSVVIGEMALLDQELASGDELLDRLREVLVISHNDLVERSENDFSLRGLGTTCVAIYRSGNKLATVHVGDSRIYLFRDDRLIQITKDHSLVQYLVDSGQITPEEAERHPKRSVILRVIGDTSASTEPDESIRETVVGDRWLLCSDGLHGVVSANTIEEILSTYPSPDECADKLIELALLAGAPDNVTCVIGDVIEDTDSVQSSPQIVGSAAKNRLQPTRGSDGAAGKAAELLENAENSGSLDSLEEEFLAEETISDDEFDESAGLLELLPELAESREEIDSAELADSMDLLEQVDSPEYVDEYADAYSGERGEQDEYVDEYQGQYADEYRAEYSADYQGELGAPSESDEYADESQTGYQAAVNEYQESSYPPEGNRIGSSQVDDFATDYEYDDANDNADDVSGDASGSSAEIFAETNDNVSGDKPNNPDSAVSGNLKGLKGRLARNSRSSNSADLHLDSASSYLFGPQQVASQTGKKSRNSRRKRTNTQDEATGEANSDNPGTEIDYFDDVDNQTRRSRKKLWLTLAIVLVILLATAFWGWRWSQNQYYVQTVGDQLMIYQGIPQNLGPIGLSREYQSTGIQVADLSEADQTRLENPVTRGSLAEIQQYLDEIRARAGEI